MTEPLSITCSPGTPVTAVTGQMRLVYLLVEVSGGRGQGALPLNLCLILDCSESMHIRLVSDEQFSQLIHMGMAREVVLDGIPTWQITNLPPQIAENLPRRIDFVRAAMVEMSRQLRPVDQYSAVAFASQAKVVLQPTSGSGEALLDAARELDQVRLGDETEIAQGLFTGMELLQQAPVEGAANRLILLTDGFTLNAASCYKAADLARENGIAISTLGIGSGFNEELLIPLAEKTGGNADYLEDPAKLPEVFQRELQAAQAVTLRNLDLKLQLMQGVELRRVHRVTPALGLIDAGPNLEGSYSIFLGDYDPSAAPTLLLELLVQPKAVGAYRLAQIGLSWEDPADNQNRQTVRQDFVLKFAADEPEQTDERVMKLVEKVSAFSVGTRALHDASSGDVEAATRRLRQAATRLLDMGETELAAEMSRQADALQNQGELDPNATKHLRYTTRKL